jgi:hypothetical protein
VDVGVAAGDVGLSVFPCSAANAVDDSVGAVVVRYVCFEGLVVRSLVRCVGVLLEQGRAY